MGVAITARVKGAGPLATKFRRAAIKASQNQLRDMRTATIMVQRHLREKLLKGSRVDDPFWGRVGAAAPTLGNVSGALTRSITSTALTANVGSSLVTVGIVGSPLLYAKTHEEGATIHGNPYLRIPTKNAKTPGGKDRLARKSARSDETLFLVQSKAGNLWLVRQTGSLKKLRAKAKKRAEDRAQAGALSSKKRRTPHFWPGLVPMYLLVKSVTIPARAPFKTALKQTHIEVLRILSRTARQVSTDIEVG